jgi:predicted nucleic acid-binding protein
MRFVDANIFLRHLVAGDPAKSRACRDLFLRVEAGSEVVTTSDVIIAEVAYVLRSRAHYGLTPAEIAERLRPLIALRGLKLDRKAACLRALDVWESHPKLDFEDALTVAHVERSKDAEVYSYDGDFDGVAGLKRVEP